jgi:hypothetical protein
MPFCTQTSTSVDQNLPNHGGHSTAEVPAILPDSCRVGLLQFEPCFMHKSRWFERQSGQLRTSQNQAANLFAME